MDCIPQDTVFPEILADEKAHLNHLLVSALSEVGVTFTEEIIFKHGKSHTVYAISDLEVYFSLEAYSSNLTFSHSWPLFVLISDSDKIFAELACLVTSLVFTLQAVSDLPKRP